MKKKKWYDSQWFSLVMGALAVSVVLGVAYLVLDDVKDVFEECDKFCIDKPDGNYTILNDEEMSCLNHKCGIVNLISTVS